VHFFLTDMPLLFTNKTSFFELLFADTITIRTLERTCFIFKFTRLRMFRNRVCHRDRKDYQVKLFWFFPRMIECLGIGFAIETAKITRLRSTLKLLTIDLSIYYLNNKINFIIIYHTYII
jgi:hypothetical protein